jgi:multicomponent Na+:H+ antiporter subunit D
MNMLQLLLFSGLAFFLLLPMMKRTLTISLDTDWLYRRLGYGLSTMVLEQGSRAYAVFRSLANRMAYRTIVFMARVTGPENVLSRTWVTGNSIMTVTAVLAVLLALFLF